ncbi:MAG: type I methionyl aminopeptidase, partial [Firmicutes bacterium]|nr:type I methionyl aminopeptidase [Bacillota bacterium]
RDLILTPEQIQGVRESGKLAVSIMDELDTFVKEGVSTYEIDELVSKRTKEAGAICADLGYNGFPKSCCTSINDVVCHGIPSKKDILKDGDIVNVDITNILNGYYADMSRMYMIGNVSDEAKRLVEVTKKSMFIGIEQIKPYVPVGNIGNAINDYIDDNGYSVVRLLTGHGVGLKFHSDPTVEHFRTRRKTLLLVPGMVLTVEPMINQGTFDCEISDEDGWTVYTSDGKLSAQWEHTILVTEDGCEILTI